LLGAYDGIFDGDLLGNIVHIYVGLQDDFLEGNKVGHREGSKVGHRVGSIVCNTDGGLLGLRDNISVGSHDELDGEPEGV